MHEAHPGEDVSDGRPGTGRPQSFRYSNVG